MLGTRRVWQRTGDRSVGKSSLGVGQGVLCVEGEQPVHAPPHDLLVLPQKLAIRQHFLEVTDDSFELEFVVLDHYVEHGLLFRFCLLLQHVILPGQASQKSQKKMYDQNR